MKTHLFEFVGKRTIGKTILHGYECKICGKGIAIDERLLDDHKFLYDNMEECLPNNKRLKELKKIK